MSALTITYFAQVILVNGQYPGPNMYMDVGDTIVVNVVNNMEQQAITLHWHGILQQVLH
jgi:FtsP/CotA-like multicopper oxidase with cupredoxin domain